MSLMKLILIALGSLALAVTPAQAQCKDCGCKEKCSPQCQCKHDEKPEPR